MTVRHVRSKYGAVKVQIDGHVFASKKESRRYAELKLLQDHGHISELELQPSFLLIPAARRPDGKLERATKYVADFSFVDHLGNRIVEDVKSSATKTREYVIKRKLLLQVHGIAVTEVE